MQYWLAFKLQYEDLLCQPEDSAENSKESWMYPAVITNVWQLRSLTLIRKELLNLLARSRSWLIMIPASQVHSQGYGDEKEPIFITGHEGQEERPCSKAFQQTQASYPTKHALAFHKREKLLTESNGELTKLLIYSVSTRCTDITQFTSWCLGIVITNGDVMPPFIFPHVLTLNTEGIYIKYLEEILLLWIEKVVAGRHYTMLHKQEEPSLGCQKDCNPFSVWDMVKRETNKTGTPKMNWSQGWKSAGAHGWS